MLEIIWFIDCPLSVPSFITLLIESYSSTDKLNPLLDSTRVLLYLSSAEIGIYSYLVRRHFSLDLHPLQTYGNLQILLHFFNKKLSHLVVGSTLLHDLQSWVQLILLQTFCNRQSLEWIHLWQYEVNFESVVGTTSLLDLLTSFEIVVGSLSIALEISISFSPFLIPFSILSLCSSDRCFCFIKIFSFLEASTSLSYLL